MTSSTKIFVDGEEGTTGLEISDRLKRLANIELLQINLSLILWYMKGQKIKQKYLDFLISRFIS